MYVDSLWAQRQTQHHGSKGLPLMVLARVASIRSIGQAQFVRGVAIVAGGSVWPKRSLS